MEQLSIKTEPCLDTTSKPVNRTCKIETIEGTSWENEPSSWLRSDRLPMSGIKKEVDADSHCYDLQKSKTEVKVEPVEHVKEEGLIKCEAYSPGLWGFMDRPIPVALYKVDEEPSMQGVPSTTYRTPNVMEDHTYSYSCMSSIGPQHLSAEIDSELHKYSHCQFTSTNEKKMEQHKLTHTGDKPFKCQVCLPEGTDKTKLLSQEQSHLGEKTCKCPFFSFEAGSIASLQVHWRIHSDKELRHQRTHTDIKPYKCLLCPYRCSYQTSLRNHERTHTGEKPYKCSLCPYSASQIGGLRVHERTRHNGATSYRCPLCPYKCARKIDLHNHERIHIGLDPF